MERRQRKHAHSGLRAPGKRHPDANQRAIAGTGVAASALRASRRTAPNLASASASTIEPKKSRRAHFFRVSTSGIHSDSFLARYPMAIIGTSSHTYQGAPSLLNRCRKPASADTPRIADANKPANVTLCPRSARHDQASAANGLRFKFTSRGSKAFPPCASKPRRNHAPRRVRRVRPITGRAASAFPRRSSRHRHRPMTSPPRALPRNEVRRQSSRASTRHRGDRAREESPASRGDLRC
jgi:hypothetical protein